MSQNQPGTTRWYHEPYAWLVFSIPFVAVLSGSAMLYLAQVNYDGMVVDDYYKRGLAIDREFARDDRATELRVAATLQVVAIGNTSLEIEPGAWQPTERVRLALVHPTRPGLDQSLELTRRSGTRYAGPGMVLADGDWHVEVAADDWRLRGRMRLPGDGRLRLDVR